MSLVLSNRTIPKDLEVSTTGLNQIVSIGDYEIPLDEFLDVARYVILNTDLDKDDPRIKFVDLMKKLDKIDGWMPGKQRLGVKI